MVAKKLLTAGSLLALVCLATGCESLSNTAKGGLIGGGAGAGLGAIAGGGKGALIGGLIGTGVGGLIGNDVDQQEKHQAQDRLAVAEARSARPPLGMSDVIQLTRDSINETVIINQIRSTGSTFQLSTEDIRTLSANNVSPNVIAEMQNRPPVARVIYRRPPPPVVYYEQPPPPVIYYGGGYRRW